MQHQKPIVYLYVPIYYYLEIFFTSQAAWQQAVMHKKYFTMMTDFHMCFIIIHHAISPLSVISTFHCGACVVKYWMATSIQNIYALSQYKKVY